MDSETSGTYKSRKSKQRAKRAEEKKEKQRALEAQHASIPGSAQSAHRKKEIETFSTRLATKRQGEVKASVDVQAMAQKALYLGEKFAERQALSQRNGFKDHSAAEASRALYGLHSTLTGVERKEKKSFPPITEKYDEWVDNLGIIAYARDLHGKYEGLDLVDYPLEIKDVSLISSPSDYNAYHGASAEALGMMNEHDRYVLAGRKRLDFEKRYIAALEALPEVKEVIALMEKNTNKQNSQMLVYELDNYLVMWRSRRLMSDMGFRFLAPDKKAAVTFIRQNQARVFLFATFQDGGITYNPGKVKKTLGPLSNTVTVMFYARTKKEILEVIKKFITAGWHAWTMSAARYSD